MKKRYLILTVIMAVLTAIFTYLVTSYDVRPVGPAGTSVGFAGFNMNIISRIGTSMTWFTVADILGYVVILIFLAFAVTGLIQLIKRKNLFKVDSNILILGGMYLLVFILYVVFEKFPVDYRPIVLPGEFEPEPSFPSSHTMLALVVLGGAIMQLKYYVKKRSLRIVFEIEGFIMVICVILARTLSGAHWPTDIIAGILYSLTLLSAYMAVSEIVRVKKEGNNK